RNCQYGGGARPYARNRCCLKGARMTAPMKIDAARAPLRHPKPLIVDMFSDDRPAGTVIGTAEIPGAVRLGCDIERQIAIDHGALRFQPLITPGWGRQGIAYGPFPRM